MTDNEAPLAKEDVQRLLSVVGDRAVLVGGQAVAWWAEFYSRQGRLRCKGTVARAIAADRASSRGDTDE